MWLGIDDVRDLNVDVIARTFEAGRTMLDVKCWRGIIFDNDLGENLPGREGCDLLEYAVAERLLDDVDTIQLVTSNPVGLLRMQNILMAEGFVQISPREFIRE